eukprot:gene14031-16539_t
MTVDDPTVATTSDNQTLDEIESRTGSGKTTTINYLCGLATRLSQTVTSDSLIKTHTTYVSKEPIYVDTPGSVDTEVSQTVTSDWLTKTNTTYVSEETIYVDTPGSDDTEGETINIANIIGVIRGVHSANRVLPVLVISSKQLQDQKDFSKVLDLAANMFDDIRSHFMSIIVLFTHMAHGSSETAATQFENILGWLLKRHAFEKQLDANSDRTALIAHMGAAVKAKLAFLKYEVASPATDYVHIVDPFDTNGRKTLQLLIKNKPAITKPSKVFKYTISSSSKTCLDNTILALQKVVKESIENGQYGRMSVAIDTIKLLSTKLGFKDLVTYNATLPYITEHYSQLSNQIKHLLADALKIGNTMDIGLVDKHLKDIMMIEQLMRQRDEISCHFSPEIETFKHVIECLVQTALICERSLKKIAESSTVKAQLDKLRDLASVNKDFVGVHNTAIHWSTTKKEDEPDKEADEPVKQLHMVYNLWRNKRLISI